MRILPEKLDCVVVTDGNPVVGLMLRAELRTTRKNPYTIIFGPTNRDGCARLDRATIIRQANNQLNLALMDFDPLEKTFSGVVRVTVMQEGDVQNALQEYELFKGAANFTDHYEDDLKAALTTVRHTDANKLNVRVEVEPASGIVLLS